MKMYPGILLICIGMGIAINGSANEQYHSHADIRKTVNSFIESYAKSKKIKQYRIEIDNIDPRLYLQKCSIPLESYLHNRSRRSAFLTVTIRCNGKSPWKIYVAGKLQYYSSIVLVKNTIPRGKTLELDDLYTERREISHMGYGFYSDPAQLVGKISRQVIFRGSVIHPQLLREPDWVRRGQTVTIIAETNGISVSMSGKAMTTGSKGKFIKVMNLSSKRIIEGIIIRPGVVRVQGL